MKTIHIVIISIVAVILIVGLAISGKNNTPKNVIPEGSTQILTVSQADRISGPETAVLTLIEYSDFQCPACAAYYPLLKQLKTDLGDDLRLVYRNFPLWQIHPNAQISAQAAEAAGLQGKFWEMHDQLFENQATWSEVSSNQALKIFAGYAEKIGLNTTQFEKDILSDLVKQKVKTDADGADALRLDGTPTFFANGKKLANPASYEELLKTTQKIIAESKVTK